MPFCVIVVACETTVWYAATTVVVYMVPEISVVPELPTAAPSPSIGIDVGAVSTELDDAVAVVVDAAAAAAAAATSAAIVAEIAADDTNEDDEEVVLVGMDDAVLDVCWATVVAGIVKAIDIVDDSVVVLAVLDVTVPGVVASTTGLLADCRCAMALSIAAAAAPNVV